MEFPARVWSITKYVYNDEEVEYDYPGAIPLWSSKEPTDEDKIRRKLAKHDSDRRVHEMRLRIEDEDRRQFEEELRRRG